MSSENKTTKTTLVVIALALITMGSLILVSIFAGRNGQLNRNLESSRLDSEVLLSEKLRLEKDLKQANQTLQLKSQNNDDLQRQYDQVAARIRETEDELRRAKNNQVSVARLTKQKEELARLQDKLADELAIARATADRLEAANASLTQDLEHLQAENQRLQGELAAGPLSFDDVLATTSSKKKKLTVKSAKVHEIVTSMEVPAKAEKISFTVTAPDGSELSGAARELSVRTSNGRQHTNRAFYASSAVRSTAGHYKEIELRYRPSKKLKPGVYKIEVFNDAVSIGSLQVKLR